MTIPWNAEFVQTQQIIASYRAGLREAGHDETRREILGMYYTHVAESLEQAQAQAEGAWITHERISAADRGVPDRPPRDWGTVVSKNRAIFGDPEMCRQHIRRIQSELGLTRIACVFHFGGLSQDRVLASLRLFAEEVAPAFASA